ncbi:MAG: hypothetical protein AAGG79_02505 [Pseudomonadota bacterium]
MAEDHGLSGLFGNKGDDKKKAPDLPPVVDDADASPLERLAKKLGDQDPYADTSSDDELHHSPFGLTVPQADAAAAAAPEAEAPAPPEIAPDPKPPVAEAPKRVAAPAPEPVAPPVSEPPVSTPPPPPAAAPSAPEPTLSAPLPDPERPAPMAAVLPDASQASESGILCFLMEGGDDRLRRRTLEALNEAAGHHGAIKLRSLPLEPMAADRALHEAMRDTDCAFAAFFHPGTEPADDWALEVHQAFARQPSAAAVSARAANSDPLSPWARVSFFIDEAERQTGFARGFDATVFRVKALRELGDDLGRAVRNGEVVHALEGQGQKIGVAVEARVKLATPTNRKDVMIRVREQARMAARIKAKGRNPLLRVFSAMFIMLGFPLRLFAVRRAAKKAVGTSQFREVASKATMAVFADRRVRALTMLSPGRGNR